MPRGRKPKNKIDDEIEVITSKVSEDTTLVTMTDQYQRDLDQATYNFANKEHIYSKYLNSVGDGDLKLSLQKVNDLAFNAQDDIEKIKQINNFVRFYINKDDLVGKVYETIENNVNTELDIIYPEIKGRNKTKSKSNAEDIINKFNDDINIENLLTRAITTAYSEGNFIMYLRNTKDSWKVDFYPLGIVEITDYDIDGEPIVVMNVDELKSRLQQVGFKDKKGKGLFATTIEEQIKLNYPEEVLKAFNSKEKYAVLNPERVGAVRINNLNKRYGISAIFKTLPAQIMLDVIEASDKKNTSAKGKKIIAQILRKEVMGEKYDKVNHFDQIAYAHNNLLSAWKNEIVVVTCPGYVEDIKYVEPKTEPTNINTINFYRTKILTALGISFLSNETKSSYTTSEINVKELAKTINKIAKQLDKILEKYYKVVLNENSLVEYAPKIKTWKSEELSDEVKLKLADAIFNKYGASYRTVYELVGVDYNTEIERRTAENESKIEEVMKPRLTSFTANSDVVNGDETKTDKTEENQNNNKDQQKQNKDRYKNELKNIQK